MAPETTDLLFTIAASLSLIVLFVSAALVLPWTEEELDEVENAFRHIVGKGPRCALSGKSVQKALPSSSYASGRTLGDKVH
jgi:hypothetical protein